LASSAEEEQERFFELFNFAPVAYVRLDPNGVIDQINPNGCALLGTIRGFLERRPFIVYVVKEDRQAFLEHMRRCRNQDSVIETTLCLQSRDGRVVPVRAFSKRALFRERTVCWTVLIDQTEQLRLEDARHHAETERARAKHQEHLARTSNEAKDRFLAMLSHELRTPLTPALFAASRLLEEDMPEWSHKLGAVIKRNIEMEARLIDDLLDVTRITRGRLEMSIELLDAHRIVLEAIEACRRDGESKKLRLGVLLNAGSHFVQGDARRLHQVFCNLLMNAIKFTDSGSIEIRTVNDESGSLRISITDTGVGMDPDNIGDLFTPFEHTDAKTSRGGLGLGLAICKGIVEAHHGRIWATSAGQGQGSVFEVELPAVPQVPAGSPDIGRDRHTRDRRHTRARILLVEDDQDTVTTLTTLLTEEGHEVGVAHSLHDALRLARGRWDVVISDLGLPDGSGLELARQFKDAKHKPRLIALSGFGSLKDRSASRDAGFKHHLVKPIEFEKLRRLLAGEYSRIG
jgi:PAS domain S-box-containing protein